MKTRYVALTALIALGLTGCTGATDEATSEPRSFAQSVPSETPEPLVAETPSPAEDSVDHAEFLTVVRGELLPDTQIRDADDAQLIEAGYEACELVKAGTPPEDIRLVEGEAPARSGYYMDTSAILFGAQTVLCPETINPPS